MKLAALLVNYYSMEKTVIACRSLLHGSRRPDRIYLVDNGSTPAESALLSSARDLEAITLIKPGANLGYAAALNRAALKAVADGCTALLILNNDVNLEYECVERLMAGWRPDSEIRSPVVFTSTAGRTTTWWSGGTVSPMTGRAVHHRHSRAEISVKPRLTSTRFVSGCSMLVGSETWLSLGGMSEEYFLYWEDVDFSYHAAKSGRTLICVNDAVMFHDVGASSGNRERFGSPTASYYGARNRWLFLRKTRFPRIAWLANLALIPVRLGRMLVVTMFVDSTARACFWAAVKGTAAGVRGDFRRAAP